MGSVSHHQARSAAFLCRARQASGSGDVADAANAMRRSASHAAAALAVNLGMRHNSRRRLEIALHAYISSGQLSRSHVKTFRQVHAFPQYLAAAETRAATRIGGRGCPLRRLRRRVAVLLKDVEAIVAGNPRPVRYHKRWLRGLPPRRGGLDSPRITSVRDILDLHNYREIVAHWGLERVPMMRRPDPHGWYARGATPERCPCHPETSDLPSHLQSRFPLSPIWQRVLEKEMGFSIPDTLDA